MKIIGIKLEYGDSSVIKNLKPGWFPFGDYQEPTKDNRWQYLKEGQQDDAEYLSRMYKSIAPEGFPDGMQLSVQCIVGKNGSGKSTLLELYYRLINDFAYHCIKKKWTGWEKLPKDIQLVESGGYSAILFFETGSKLQYLYRNESNTEYVEINDGSPRILFDGECPQYGTENLAQIMHSFFYTTANNYSFYSLNPNDYHKNEIGNNNYLEKNDGKWLECIFHKNDGYLTPLVMVPFRDENGNIDRENEDSLAKQRLSTLAILFESQGLSFSDNFHPKQLIYRFNPRSKDYYWEKTKEAIVSKKAIDLFLSCFDYGPNCKLKEKKDFVISSIKNVLNPGKRGGGLCIRIKAAWDSYLKEESLLSANYEKYNKNVKEAISNYLTYKTLKICFTYPSYGQLIIPTNLIIQSSHVSEITGAVRHIIKNLDTMAIKDLILHIISTENSSHITQKIRQCLTFVSRDYYKTRIQARPHSCFINDNGENSFLAENYAIDKKLHGAEREKSGYQTYEEVFLRMPPPFFDYELLFRQGKSEEGTKPDGGKGLPTLNSMSSGQRHDLVSTSYLMYHLTNLQSVQGDRFRVPYHHVNLIFDEVELYFHPEYQRKYLANLLKTLSQCHISSKKIKSINIIIVTHSPFILSDVPLSHTLYLENGAAKERDDETFSANIHNLLVNQFFIEQPMGEVAVNVINEIVMAKKVSRENYDYYMFIANKVGDPYISNRLKNIIESKSKDIARLKKEQERLERRLEEIKLQLSNESNKEKE